MTKLDQKIPKTIWFLWLQGIAQAPPIIKMCLDSWQRENPDWNLVVLDEKNLHQYVNIDLSQQKIDQLMPNWYADLIRLKLLMQHGGVWVDATCYCTQPLDQWLFKHRTDGLFIFHNNARDRLLSTWFLAASADNYVLSKTYQCLISYWSSNNFISYKKDAMVRVFLEKIFNRNVEMTRFWFNPIVTNVLRIAPYYNFHYWMARCIQTDPLYAKAINSMGTCKQRESISNAEGKRMFRPINDDLKKIITNKQIPLLKLTWKDHKLLDHKNSIYQYLLSLQ